MKENLTKEIKEIINDQTRNGRTKIYVRVKDLKRLGAKVESKEERIYVESEYLKNLLDEYENER